MFTKVLFPIDLREEAFSLEALRFAVEQARKNDAEIYVLTVLPDVEKPTTLDYHHDEGTLQAIEHTAHEQLDALLEQQVPEGIRVTKIVSKGGAPHDEIVRHAERNHVDLIVIPSHDRSAFEEFLLGSCAAKVVRHAHCSVMVMRKPKKHPR